MNEPSIFLSEISQNKIDDHSLLTSFHELEDDGITYEPEDDYQMPKKQKPNSFLIDIDEL